MPRSYRSGLLSTDTSGSRPYWAGVIASVAIFVLLVAAGAPFWAAVYTGSMLGLGTVGGYLVCVMPVGGPSR